MGAKCKHNVDAYFCKLCPGKGICKCGKRKYVCRTCGNGSSFCQHNKIKWDCSTCKYIYRKGTKIDKSHTFRVLCQHNIEKKTCDTCKDLNLFSYIIKSKDTCRHGKIQIYCRQCGGAATCEHTSNKYKCDKCRPKIKSKNSRQRIIKPKIPKIKSGPYKIKHCPHGKRKYHCRDCGGAGVCEHTENRFNCSTCKNKTELPDEPTEILTLPSVNSNLLTVNSNLPAVNFNLPAVNSNLPAVDDREPVVNSLFTSNDNLEKIPKLESF